MSGIGKMINKHRSGQSILEYVVLLAIIAIVAISIVTGLGMSTRNSVAQANEAMSEANIAAQTGGAKPGGGLGGGSIHH